MNNDERNERAIARDLNSLRERAKKLADWYKANRPAVEVIRVTEDEYKTLKQFPAIASGCGFHREGGEFVLSGFKILPPPLSTSHTPLPCASEKP